MILQQLLEIFQEAATLDDDLTSFDQGDITQIGNRDLPPPLLYFQTPVNNFFNQPNNKVVTVQFGLLAMTHVLVGEKSVGTAMDLDFSPPLQLVDENSQPIPNFATIKEVDRMGFALSRAISYANSKIVSGAVKYSTGKSISVISFGSYHSSFAPSYAGYRAELNIELRNAFVNDCDPYLC